MLVLGIDTATPVASVGLIEDGRLLVEQASPTSANHAESLLPLIQRVLGQAQMTVPDIAGLGVTLGPGAFSGLRIGLSTVKGFAYAHSQRVVGLSTLSTLAHAVTDWTGKFCIVLDARKREVYAAFFERDAEGQVSRLTQDAVLSPRELTSQLTTPCLFVGDGVDRYGDVITENCGPDIQLRPLTLLPPRGRIVAQLAWEHMKRGEADDVAELVPHYIRRSDAERNWIKTHLAS